MAVRQTQLAATAPFRAFTRHEWAQVWAATPLTLSNADLAQIRAVNERVSPEEVTEVYLLLARLINLQAGAKQIHRQAMMAFLGEPTSRITYIVGIGGSVAVGKTTAARVLQVLLARLPEHCKVDVVTTDGFLFPKRALEARGLMQCKGFPESYDYQRLIRFLTDARSGRARITVPIYSHVTYDVLPWAVQVVECPDILIVEGLNILQLIPGRLCNASQAVTAVSISDFLDFSIYVDAVEEDIRRWYVERFLTLRAMAFERPDSYFFRYTTLPLDEAANEATRIWADINAVNLREHIRPTRWRAHVILEKGPDHSVRGVQVCRY